MNRHLITIFISFLILVVIFVLFRRSEKITGVEIGGKIFSIELAQTKKELEKGLSGHAPLLDGQGMLFVFSRSGRYGFWMKDMSFPIDIIWIDSNFKIVSIEKSVLPETYPEVFYPESSSLYVLEILAGQADTIGLKTGDGLQFIKK